MRPKKARVLIVDDEPDMADNLGMILRDAGHETYIETDSTKAMAQVEKKRPDLVITDLRMPQLDGVSLLERIKASQPHLPVLVVTAYASVDSAVEAMKKGASDYLSKPFSPDELIIRFEKALAWSDLTEENRFLRERVEGDEKYGEIIGQSRALNDILLLVDKVAATDARVLVVGESGTGKELIARTIHRKSGRREAHFFAVNCGALSENLLESELFGHERGAFTGAVTTKKGIFEVADGGTLFLDEVSETSPSFQTKLLRVLQDGEFRRVGGTRPLKSDVRLISATNRNPDQCVEEGVLREDLYYRMSVIKIQLPPLRERLEDIPSLVEHFLAIYQRRLGKTVQSVHHDVMEALSRYAWPGNVRELENVMERAVILMEGNKIQIEDLCDNVLIRRPKPHQAPEQLKEMERELILKTLKECRWNRSLTAKKLGIGRRTLYDKLARFGISLSPTG